LENYRDPEGLVARSKNSSRHEVSQVKSWHIRGAFKPNVKPSRWGIKSQAPNLLIQTIVDIYCGD
jgi:hypothetical protein